ncbi:MAG: hypothetical protein ACE147_10695, partial [Candidatus Methylomirabilales bacterium]
VIRLLGTHRERILDLQLLQERVAAAVVDLYAMAAVIGKLQMLCERGAARPRSPQSGNGHHPLDRDTIVGTSFCHHAARRVRGQLRGLFANQDEWALRAADAVLGRDQGI